MKQKTDAELEAEYLQKLKEWMKNAKRRRITYLSN